MVETIKRLVKQMEESIEHGNTSLCRGKKTQETYVAIQTNAMTYEQGERDRKAWLSILQEASSDDPEIKARYSDLNNIRSELQSFSQKIEVAFQTINEAVQSGKYNVNQIAEDLEIVKKFCETFILPRIDEIKNKFPGLISDRPASMILDVKLLGVQVSYWMEKFYKPNLFTQPEHLKISVEYLSRSLVQFTTGFSKESENVDWHENETVQSHKIMIEEIEELIKRI